MRFKRKRKITNAKIYEDKRDLYCILFDIESNISFPIVPQNAEALLNGRPLPTMRQVHVARYRHFVRSRIIQKGREYNDDICDMPCCTSPKYHLWVQCEMCDR